MQNNEKLRLEILQLKNTVTDCKAAIRDAIYCAEETSWKKLWVARYSYLLDLHNS